MALQKLQAELVKYSMHTVRSTASAGSALSTISANRTTAQARTRLPPLPDRPVVPCREHCDCLYSCLAYRLETKYTTTEGQIQHPEARGGCSPCHSCVQTLTLPRSRPAHAFLATRRPLPTGTIWASTRLSARARLSTGATWSRWLITLSATRSPPCTSAGTRVS